MQRKIAQGHWKEGERLPSIRSLAKAYQCSKSTVIRAFHQLEQQHLVYAKAQSGYFVVKKGSQEDNKSGEWIDFASASPDSQLFPYRDFQHCLNQAIDRYQDSLFVYGTSHGLLSLIEVLQKHLAAYQVFADLNQFVITSGVQRALSILTMMPFPNQKEMVLVEQPTYHLLVQLLKLAQLPSIGIERTAKGIDLDYVEHLFQTKSIKFFYTTSRFHNPLGTSYTQAEKKELAELARRYQVYIVEDDYLVDFEVDSKADPIYSYNRDNVIYLKSFSKNLFPGLRVGVIILPSELISSFIQYKSIHDIDSSMLSQAGLEIYIKNGMYQYHQEKIRAVYVSRMKKLNQVLDNLEIADTISYPVLQSGLHSHLLLKYPISLPKLQSKLDQYQVRFGTMYNSYLSSYPAKRMIRLNLSTVPEVKIEEGVTRVVKEINRLSHLQKRQFF
ncbi:transcriptional regulator, GntR family [Seinonella peptonophila]|uniref:Transcriptional regulator, GntR family n=2 Tax=Seinonella peptonophila TaxID=112248 RepID=A0A1M5BLT9_9BACL|nr:transcriptional regulator, GntR family [Seinonella peptonophila]